MKGTPGLHPQPVARVRAQPGIWAGLGILQGRAVALGNERAPPSKISGPVIGHSFRWTGAVSRWGCHVPVTCASSRFTSQLGEEAGGSRVAGPMIRPSPIGGRDATYGLNWHSQQRQPQTEEPPVVAPAVLPSPEHQECGPRQGQTSQLGGFCIPHA